MPYIITNGSSYCQKTKTQAVLVVNEASAATTFKNREDAEKLLQRATRKLKGFEIKEMASEHAGSGTDQTKSRKARAGKAAAQGENTKAAEKAKPSRKARSQKKPVLQEQTAGSAAAEDQLPADAGNAENDAQVIEAAAAPETPAENEKQSEKPRRNRNRRTRRTNSHAGSAAEELKPVTAASEVPEASAQETTQETAASEVPEASAQETTQETVVSEVPEASAQETTQETAVSEVPEASAQETTQETAASEVPEASAQETTQETAASEVPEASAQETTQEIAVSEVPEASAWETTQETEASAAAEETAEEIVQEAGVPVLSEDIQEPDARSQQISVLDDIQAASAILWATDDVPVRKNGKPVNRNLTSVKQTKTDIQDAFAALWGNVIQTPSSAAKAETAQAEKTAEYGNAETVGTQEAAASETAAVPETETVKETDSKPEVIAVNEAVEEPEKTMITECIAQSQEPETEASGDGTDTGVIEDAAETIAPQPKELAQNDEPVKAAEEKQENAAAQSQQSSASERESRNERYSRRGRRRSNNARRNQNHDQENTAVDNSSKEMLHTAGSGNTEKTQTVNAPSVTALPAAEPAVNTVNAAGTAGTANTAAPEKNPVNGQRRGPQNRRPKRIRIMDEQDMLTKRRLFTTQERNQVYNRTEGHCGICGRFIPLEEYTIDHIIPLSKGGTNELDNLQACCGFCNKAKDDSMGDDFFDRIERIFLYQAKLKYGKKQMKKLKKVLKEIED